MKPTLCFTLSVVLVIAAHVSGLALTTDSLSCSGGVISLGDFASDVIGKCGEPAYAAQREEKIVDGDIFSGRIVTTFTIDDWTFNFGPTKFQCRLLLRNGKIWRIETMGYGY